VERDKNEVSLCATVSYQAKMRTIFGTTRMMDQTSSVDLMNESTSRKLR